MTFNDNVALVLTFPSLVFYTIDIGWLPTLACAFYWIYRIYNEYKKNK